MQRSFVGKSMTEPVIGYDADHLGQDQHNPKRIYPGFKCFGHVGQFKIYIGTKVWHVLASQTSCDDAKWWLWAFSLSVFFF